VANITSHFKNISSEILQAYNIIDIKPLEILENKVDPVLLSYCRYPSSFSIFYSIMIGLCLSSFSAFFSYILDTRLNNGEMKAWTIIMKRPTHH